LTEKANKIKPYPKGLSKKLTTSLPGGTVREYSSLKWRRNVNNCKSIFSPP
jgi:hypothetical protein